MFTSFTLTCVTPSQTISPNIIPKIKLAVSLIVNVYVRFVRRRALTSDRNWNCWKHAELDECNGYRRNDRYVGLPYNYVTSTVSWHWGGEPPIALTCDINMSV